MNKEGNKTNWKPRPKIIAAALVGGLVYLLGALGVDVGVILQEAGELVGADLPDQKALTTFLAALIAGYFKKDKDNVPVEEVERPVYN